MFDQIADDQPFIFVNKNQQRIGPLSKQQLLEAFMSGNIVRGDFVSLSGFDQWMPLTEPLMHKLVGFSHRPATAARISMADTQVQNMLFIRSETSLFRTTIRDLSSSGLFAYSYRGPFAVSEPVELNMRVNGHVVQAQLDAIVVRQDDEGYGLHFGKEIEEVYELLPTAS